MKKQQIAPMIDHTALKPVTTGEDIIRLCREAVEFGFGAVCINPVYIKIAHRQLQATGVKVGTVVGFPLGATTTAVKAFETKEAVNAGADEIDMVLNIGALKEKNEQYVTADIAAVVQAAPGKIVKVILETSLLANDEKILACKLVKKAGAHFVKTATGFGPGGATVADIQLMRQVVGAGFGIKASGGVKNWQDTLAMIEAGATRIGTSSGIAIMQGKCLQQ